MPLPSPWVANAIAAAMGAPGLLLILSGAALGIRESHRSANAWPTRAGVMQLSRRLFLTGWVALGAAVAAGMAYVRYYFPD
jgi:hypothetical protein